MISQDVGGKHKDTHQGWEDIIAAPEPKRNDL